NTQARNSVGDLKDGRHGADKHSLRECHAMLRDLAHSWVTKTKDSRQPIPTRDRSGSALGPVCYPRTGVVEPCQKLRAWVAEQMARLLKKGESALFGTCFGALLRLHERRNHVFRHAGPPSDRLRPLQAA